MKLPLILDDNGYAQVYSSQEELEQYAEVIDVANGDYDVIYDMEGYLYCLTTVDISKIVSKGLFGISGVSSAPVHLEEYKNKHQNLDALKQLLINSIESFGLDVNEENRNSVELLVLILSHCRAKYSENK
ncbi:hypothetical protein [Wohlfahrtiimonas populi]|uniref:hypothetical protein n=1 Tax=Wohlfahrtiimonas populi TaxID=1940240 RepID=UPI00098CF38B|nr:hypothetical protein [Wohlfahrtiimonas populi]